VLDGATLCYTHTHVAGVGFPGTERYQVRRRLGAGSFGEVYEVHDRVQSVTRALKVLTRFGAADVIRFKREFRALQDLHHPNLVGLGELVHADDRWFYTMNLVQGVDFMSYVRPFDERATKETLPAKRSAGVEGLPETGGEVDEPRLRRALGDLARGLMALHTAGHVHRDVKPSNVLVDDDGHAVLLDFGLITERDLRADLTQDAIVGTVHYMAPEQAAGKRIGPAADWYSLGVMLFEALTGRLPFDGTTMYIAMAKQEEDPGRPSDWVRGVLPDLDDLCYELLRFDPAKRPSGEQVIQALGTSPMRVRAASSVQSRSSVFFGRQQELAQLREAFDCLRDGESAAVIVHGESGVGKSALLSHFTRLSQAKDPRVVVLSGRCYERESIPYKALDGVVDQLASWVSRLDDTRAAELLPRYGFLLPRLFPVLARVDMLASAPSRGAAQDDGIELRDKAFTGLRELFQRISMRTRLIVVIDDLQWSDRDSLELLSSLLRPPDAPPMLLLVSSRSEVTADLGDNVRTLPLGPLEPDDARKLTAALLRRENWGDELANTIAQEANGHPLFIDELVRHAAIAPSNDRTGLRLDGAIWARIGKLSEDAQQLIEYIAVAGSPIGIDVLEAASRLGPEPLARSVAALRAAQLVRGGEQRHADEVMPYHDRIREAVHRELSSERRTHCHKRLASGLESTGGRPEQLLRHLRGAGLDKKAGRAAEQAADRAAAALAFDRAASFYETALELGEHKPEPRRVLNLHLSNALTSAGRGRDAARAALRGAEGADETTKRECMARAAHQLLICGHVEEGLDVLGDALSEIDVSMPATPRRALASVLWNRLKLRVHGLKFKERHKKEVAASELTRVDLFNAAGQGLAMVDNVRGAAFQAQGTLAALRSGEPYRVARAFGTEAVYMGSQGDRGRRRARRLLRTMQELSERHKSPALIAWTRAVSGMTSYFGGDFPTGVRQLQEAIEIYEEQVTGHSFELTNSRMFLMFALRHHGRLGDLTRLHADFMRDAVRRGDRYIEQSLRLHGTVTKLAVDDPEERAEMSLEPVWLPPPGRYHLQHWYELEAGCEVAIYTGQAVEAYAEFEPKFADLNSSMLTRVQIIRALSRFALGRMLISVADDEQNPASTLKRVRKLTRQLRAEPVAHARIWGHALEISLATVSKGATASPEAVKEMERAAADAHMDLFTLSARYRRGQLTPGERGAELKADASKALNDMGVKNPRKLVRVQLPGRWPDD